MMRDQSDSKLHMCEDCAPCGGGDAPSYDPRFRNGNYIFKPTDSLQFRIVDDT
jgi:hypothetical protein